MSALTEDVKSEVQRLLSEGKRQEAVQYLEREFNISYAESDMLLRTLEQPHDAMAEARSAITSKSSGCLVSILRAIAIFFCFFTFGFFVAAIAVHVTNQVIISKSVCFEGKVIGFDSDSSGVAPIVEYESGDLKLRITGSTHSTPPPIQ